MPTITTSGGRPSLARAPIVPATTRASLTAVKGFLVPMYTQTDSETGQQLYGLTPGNYELVRHGYACPNCLADFGGIYQMVCPACGHTRDVRADIVAEPNYWKPDPKDPSRRA